MTVYQRIANPWMPQGLPSLTNADPSTFHAPGEIGGAFNDGNTGRGYARVKLDSGATSATPVGVVAVGQLAFWKDRVNNIVTNDKRVSDGSPTANGALNRVAGIFGLAVTAGYVCDIVINGKGVTVASDGSGTAGVQAIADSTASVARVAPLATATTAPTSQVVGVMVAAPSGGFVACDVTLGFIG